MYVGTPQQEGLHLGGVTGIGKTADSLNDAWKKQVPDSKFRSTTLTRVRTNLMYSGTQPSNARGVYYAEGTA